MSQFNNVLISSLSPDYVVAKLTGSQREIVNMGLIMTLIATNKKSVAAILRAVILSKSNFTAIEMTADRETVLQIALSLSSGHPRSVQMMIDVLDSKSKDFSLWDQDNWKIVFDTFLKRLSVTSIGPSKVPSLELLERIATRGMVDADAIARPGMTVSVAVEEGYVHVVPGPYSHSPHVMILDLLPTQMREAIRFQSKELRLEADWGCTWNTSCSAPQPTAFQFLCLLLQDYLSPSTDILWFHADGAELCADWSVIRSIQ